MSKKILIIFGTRPEAIKLAKLIDLLKKNKKFEVKICVTGQHEQMLNQVLRLFKIKPNYNFKVMKTNQSLNLLGSKILEKVNNILIKYKPDIALVHGDTTTAYISSLAAFQNKVKIGHIEAGLRTHNIKFPYPEEFNRRSIGTMADIHFTPTNNATQNLINENISKNQIIKTGNTVVDTLNYSNKILYSNLNLLKKIKKKFSFLNYQEKIIIVTAHRRENYGKGIKNICSALKEIAKKNKKLQIIYPVHLNPKVAEVVQKYLSKVSNIFLLKPLDYFSFIYLMKVSYLILTDSGGIQEEAPTFKKPVLVLRNETERPEAKDFGSSIMVGTNKNKIIKFTNLLIRNKKLYIKMTKIKNPYGDGKATERIVKQLKKNI